MRILVFVQFSKFKEFFFLFNRVEERLKTNLKKILLTSSHKLTSIENKKNNILRTIMLK